MHPLLTLHTHQHRQTKVKQTERKLACGEGGVGVRALVLTSRHARQVGLGGGLLQGSTVRLTRLLLGSTCAVHAWYSANGYRCGTCGRQYSSTAHGGR